MEILLTSWGGVIIGDNCFIGYGSIILPGVSIADNTIVAAGSVVTKSMNKSGYVIGGNPARVICTIKEYQDKNIPHQVNLDGMNMENMKKLIEENPKLLISKKNII